MVSIFVKIAKVLNKSVRIVCVATISRIIQDHNTAWERRKKKRKLSASEINISMVIVLIILLYPTISLFFIEIFTKGFRTLCDT